MTFWTGDGGRVGRVLTAPFFRLDKLANHAAARTQDNLVKMHGSIGMTPAVKEGLNHRIRSVGELLAA